MNEFDQRELYATTITYEINDDDLPEPKLSGFESCERGLYEIFESESDEISVHVKLDADITCDKAVSALKTIIAEIEQHGLPPARLFLPGKLAKLIEKSEEKLPEEMRYLVRRLLSKTSEEADDHD
jgi:hypothetical protein